MKTTPAQCLNNHSFLIIIFSAVILCSCSRYVTENGNASYYANSFEGKKTANGETFHQNELTAAHKRIPFGTLVTVKNKSNGKIITVRINDRGPFVKGRIIDLSSLAAQQLDMVNAGVVPVQIKYKRKKK